MKIAVSGTYSTGKTTFSYALSFLTGIPRTEAKTMRELLVTTFPNKMLEECHWNELFTLTMMRFRDRIMNEAKLSSGYISDGSVLHEWAYGEGRLLYGVAPQKRQLTLWEQRFHSFLWGKGVKDFLCNFGTLVKEHAKSEYDLYLHFPIEFPITSDRHRPMSEGFRKYTNEVLYKTEKALGIPVIEISGTLDERLEKTVEALSLSPRMSIREAIIHTQEALKKNNIALEELHRRKSLSK